MQKTISFASILLCALLVLAADNYKPLNVKTGLWQVTVIHTASGAPPIPADMQARMAKMTPEQRARVEEMIRSRFGGTPQTTTYNKCVTTKNLNTNPWANGSDEKCNWTVLNSTASDMDRLEDFDLSRPHRMRMPHPCALFARVGGQNAGDAFRNCEATFISI